jgi:hypothetical protein
MKNFSNLLGKPKLLAAALLCGALIGCGGGGGGGDPAPNPASGGTPPTPPPTTAFDTPAAQGRWLQGDLTALVLQGQAGASDVWMVQQTPTHLYKYEIASTAKVTGFKYPLTGTGVREAVTGDATLNKAVTPKTLAFTNGTLSTFSLSQTDALSGNSALPDVAGNWTFTVAQGAVKFDATINATGVFSASTVSDDCTYSGQLTSTAASTIFKITYQSACQGSTSSMSGIARWVAASNMLTILSVSTDGLSAGLISMQKP